MIEKMMSKRLRSAGGKSICSEMYLCSSNRPNLGFAAARIAHRDWRTAVMPAFATLIRCCSIASWIADPDQWDTPPDPPAVGHDLPPPAEQLEGEGLLLDVHPIDRGCDRRGDQAENVRARSDLPDPMGIFLRDLDFFKLDPFHFDRVDVDEDVEQGGALSRPSPLHAAEDSVQDDPLPRRDPAGQIVFHIGAQALRFLPAAEPLRRLLHFDLLRVQVQRRLREEFEFRRARGPFASALLLVAFQRLSERLPVLLFLDDRPESIQVEERGLEAPRLRVAVGHRDDFREVSHLLEELLPLRDQLILWKLDEHILPPARRRRSIGNGHISLSPPSSGRSLRREYRSDHFHWNGRGLRCLIRIASTRTRRIECSRPRAGGPHRIQDTRDGGRCRFRQMWFRDRPKRRARLSPRGSVDAIRAKRRKGRGS